ERVGRLGGGARRVGGRRGRGEGGVLRERGVGSRGQLLARREGGEAGSVGAVQASVGADIHFKPAALAGELSAEVQLHRYKTGGDGDVVGAERGALLRASRERVVKPEPQGECPGHGRAAVGKASLEREGVGQRLG